jgi:hypothetical protein
MQRVEMSDSYSIYFKADLMCLVHDSQKKSTDEYPFEIQYADKLPGGLQIIRLYVSESNLSTGFGIHGALEIYVGDRQYETQDEEDRDNPGWNLTCYAEGFQQFLEFFTSLTYHSSIHRLSLYICKSALNESIKRLVGEYEFSVDLYYETVEYEGAEQFSEFMARTLGKVTVFERMTEQEVKNYIDSKFLDSNYIHPSHR